MVRISPSRPLAVLATATAISLIGTGCGSGAPPSGTQGTGTAAVTTAAGSGASSSSVGTKKKLTVREQGIKFAECIRAHGVADFPDPDAKGEFAYGVSVTPAVWQRATTACKDLQPPGALSSKRTPKEQASSLVFAQCIRDNGVKDFPDPVNGEPFVNTYKIPSSDTARGMAILNAAMQKCGKAFGLGAGGRG